MECPKCQFENPDGVNFCVECGGKLETICPKCGYRNSLSHKFCGGCGHKLSLPEAALPKDLSFDEKLTKIQRYLPKGLTEKILSQRDRIEGERKQVTVMFCDMEGFTQLSESLGAEEAYAIMDQVYEILIHKVHDYEGTVNEMTGDGIMALFGAPIALEDAPQRAIRSAHGIHREMSRFSDKIKQENDNIPPLKMRIGIHTGPVVVGTLGNDLRVEFKAVGDTVNLASRMEGLAEPGSTYVTEDTYRRTEGLFRFEVLGDYSVKGRADTVKAYRVIAPSTRRTRFDVSAERGLTPFVGRERELDLLLDSFEKVKARRGQAISVTSEAGVGKSRLLYEFRKRVSNEDVTFLEGKCLSYSRGVAYHPVLDILKSNFNIGEGDNDAEIGKKIKRGLKILAADEATTLPYLLELLSVKDSGIDKIMMSPEGRRDRIIEALKRIVLKGSGIRPLVMAIEDLHWADKSSEEVLKFLLESIPGTAVFLIFTYRPEFVHTWGGKSYHSQVNLNRLSNRESLAMLSHLLGAEDIDESIEELVLEKTEGVPFFIEEFIKSLKDLKVIEKKDSKYRLAKEMQEISIPTTIQEVIMARVDSLPEGTKEVLQAGSVIEREFSHKLIMEIMNLPEKELLSHLSILKDSELIYERGIYPESTYLFKHALTQEVVYDSILTKRRKRLHEEVGNVLEKLYKHNIDEYYGVLSQHYVKSDSFEKGAEYSRLASKKAEKTASLNDAIFFTKKMVACLEKLPKRDDVQRRLISARTMLGLYDIQMNYFHEAKEVIDLIFDIALTQGSKRRLSQIYLIKGVYDCWVEEDYPETFRNLDKALKISKETNDIVAFLLASYWMGMALFLSCKFDKAFDHYQRALDLDVAANSLWGISTMKSNISILFNYQGIVTSGYQNSVEAIRIAEESADLLSRALAHTTHGVSCYFKGFLDAATEHLSKGCEFNERIDLPLWIANSLHFLGKTYFELGAYQKSKNHFDQINLLCIDRKIAPSWANLAKLGAARATLMSNKENFDLESFFSFVHENKIKLFDGEMRRYIGEILLNTENQNTYAAKDWIEGAIESYKKNSMKWFVAKSYALYAEMFRRTGEQSKARENLSKAIEIFKECGADGWGEKYEKELARI